MIPVGYKTDLNLKETEEAIKYIKGVFQSNFAKALNLQRVSAPIMVLSETGINDHLSGVEKPITFSIKDIQKQAEIVQSLAKWKRMALRDYGFKKGEGLYTDMNALRPDESLDNLHSIYVDQWDWERVIDKKERNITFLKMIVREIYAVIREKEREICETYPQIPAPYLPEDITFIHSEDLESQYPDLTPRERENAICQEKGAVFIIGLGSPLRNGKPHDGRAADYDDWTTENEEGQKGLNGDILVWYPLLDRAFELSSMGIRVDPEALLKQLEIKREQYKKNLYFHNQLLQGRLPLCIGGGIGQSRLCMFYLRKAHIGEVQCSIWSDRVREVCEAHQIFLL
ncbi:aspartate--ammonia ligase [bacterium]|nr:aspartate--ammonia ligase [bacterium]